MLELKEPTALTFEEGKHEYRVNGKFIWSVSHYLKPISSQIYGDIDKSILDKAARRGTAIHFAIELFNAYRIIEIDDIHMPWLEAYMRWFREYNPLFLHEEKRTYHPVYWYAGTCDLICVIDDETWLVDYKAVADLKKLLVAPQLAAYAKAWESQGLKIDRVASLHLKKTGEFSFEEYPVQENFNVFLECLSIQSYIDKHTRRW